MATASPVPHDALARAPVHGALGFLRSRLLGAPTVSPRRKAIAVGLAAAADLLQVVLWPLFVEGASSPFEDALDVVIGIALLFTLGFSGRLALAFAIELIPGADMFPTWTAVVASITSAPALPPAPAPADPVQEELPELPPKV